MYCTVSVSQRPTRTTLRTRETRWRGASASLWHSYYTCDTPTREHRHSLTFRDDEGSYEHDLGYCKAKNSAKHPAARGIVDGLVDHEGKVTAAFIASAQNKD